MRFSLPASPTENQSHVSGYVRSCDVVLLRPSSSTGFNRFRFSVCCASSVRKVSFPFLKLCAFCNIKF